MTRVSISKKAAVELLERLHPDGSGHWAVEELRRSLKAKPKKKLPFPSRAKLRVAKKKAKREETADIRAAVVNRANGRCECCGREFSTSIQPQLDHFFGRVKVKQSVQNCWLLRSDCHWGKTNNVPDAAYWLRAFITHAQHHGYTAEVKRASDRLASIELSQLAGWQP